MAMEAKNTIHRIIAVLKKEWISVIFSIIWLAAWTADAFKVASFDMTQLTVFFTTIRAAILADYTVDSTVNSPKGEHPYKPNNSEPKDGC